MQVEDTKQLKPKPFVPWEGQERIKPDWFLIKHGQYIPCQMEQK
jgi:hypothetical protein